MERYMKEKNQRFELIFEMQQLEAQGMGCRGCAGNCCTFEANSMMITPLETIELLSYLEISQLKNPELKEKLENTIKKYRLDQFAGNGRRIFVRRTYTCPFFAGSELGCPLPREVKPYGCLAFNSHHESLKAGEYCYSDKELLQNLESKYPEIKNKNQLIKESLKLDWEKKSIPEALLDLWDNDANQLMSKILD